MKNMNLKPSTLIDLGENITRIVITGGPCSGKTTGLSVLSSKLTDRGYKVLISPESATKLINSGIVPKNGELSIKDFQALILLDTLEQEERILSAAEIYRDQGKKVVILCDRGTMDGKAYIDHNDFNSLLVTMGFNQRQLCDDRYHAVMHMRTAALGAEPFYTLANNNARSESPEDARLLDHRNLDSWQRHPHPRVIDNSTDFGGKIRRLLAEVCNVLGDPIPIEMEEKFLVDSSDEIEIPVNFTESHIVQDYLVSTDPREVQRVRMRSDGDGSSYYYTRKISISPGQNIEIERMVGYGEYVDLLKRKDHTYQTMKKRRVCLFWNEQFIELDFFEYPSQIKGLVIMEIEHTGDSSQITIPPFVNVIRNVTREKGYSNAEIAKRAGASHDVPSRELLIEMDKLR